MESGTRSDSPSVGHARRVIEAEEGRAFACPSSQHDVDLRSTIGPPTAVEVKRLFSEVWQRSGARLRDHGRMRSSQILKDHWTLSVPLRHRWPDETGAPNVRAIHENIETYLLQLEALGVSDTRTAIGTRVPGKNQMESMRFMFGLMSKVSDLLGAGSWAMSQKPTKTFPTGWTLNVMRGGSATMQPNVLAEQLSDLLLSEEQVPSKLRRRLAAADDELRWGFLVLDTSFNLGLSMYHLGGALPTQSLRLPQEIDRLWLSLPNVSSCFYDRHIGWRQVRLDSEVSTIA